MKVIRKRLSKAEIDYRLKYIFKSIVKGDKKLSPKQKREKVDNLLKVCRQQASQIIAARKIRAVYEASKKKVVKDKKAEKKSGMVMTKCLGTSRKRCPDCDERLKIWGSVGMEHLMCSRCGWNELAEKAKMAGII